MQGKTIRKLSNNAEVTGKLVFNKIDFSPRYLKYKLSMTLSISVVVKKLKNGGHF